MRVSALLCVVFVFAAALVSGDQSAAHAAEPAACNSSGNLSYVCNAVNVEDMVQVPGTRWLIGSSMHFGKDIPQDAAGLYVIDTVAKSATRATISIRPEDKNGPFAGCPAPTMTALGSHGLELRPGPAGRHTLYTVNHGGRETLEVFEVEGGNSGPPTLTWIGCLKMPANMWANAIAALPGGALAITKFGDLDTLDMARVIRGETTGAVYLWKPGVGFSELAGSRFSGNNGMVASQDGKWLYVNDQGHSRVVRLALDGSEPPKFAKVNFLPDNLRWAPDGTILAAGQVLVVGDSLGVGHAWGVARVNPQTMQVTPVLDEQPRPEFSNATVAIQVDHTIYVGTFRGERVAYFQVK